MLNITYKNQVKQVPVGTKLIDFLDETEKTNYIVCRVGLQIKELNYALQERNNGMEIEFLGLENIEAGKAYEASLRFIIAMAFHNLYKDVDIRFSYNVSRAIFCQVLTPGFHLPRATDAIISEVKRIIEANLPIERVTVTIDEAKEIYKQYNHQDKLDILKYRPENTVHLYKCGDYYDYMHSYMVASTGCIKQYVIRPYSPGIIIQYPRYELNAKIPEFVEESTYGRTLKQAYNWSKKTKLQTVIEINAKVETNNVLDFVQMCEAKHNRMLVELGNNIEQDIENIRLIAIAGPSSSGKTTFCNRVRIELLSRGINPVMISMDDYYLEKEKISEIQNKPIDQLDLEHINCLDVDLFNKDLYDLINGEEVTLPRFNFQTGKREVGRTIKVDSNSPIMIEGIHALNEKLTASIPKHQKYKIYIAPQAQINIDDHSPLNTTDLRLIRRIVRDMKYRNCPAAETIKMWQSVRNGEFKWIYPNQEDANYVFNSELAYELCVLRTKALPALREIKPTDPEFLVANRLIKYIKYFRPIDDESIIPCNSLLREFIGGSCFKL
ncbi:MAG: hypothetical protein PUG14_03615 [Acholeplasmatales bacterium]|nr:hypothetical protein [Acholeplasmatales bacterium]